MASHASNPLGDRERAAEDLFIRQREAEKAAAAKEKQRQEAQKAAADKDKNDEEELINTKPRCLWPDDGRDYGERDDYYEEEEQQWDEPERHEELAKTGPSVHYHHDEHNQLGAEQQGDSQTPPPASPLSPRPQNNYQSNTYEERYDILPEQPTINRGYIAEAVTMVQHPPRSAISRQDDGLRDYHDYSDEEDTQDIGKDDTMYTDFYDGVDSGDEESSPLYSQEIANNPFEHIPDPEKDWILAQERERQRIASKDKLGIVGRGIKYPIPADLLEAPSPTTTFGRKTLWPMRIEEPSSPRSQQWPPKLVVPTDPRPFFFQPSSTNQQRPPEQDIRLGPRPFSFDPPSMNQQQRLQPAVLASSRPFFSVGPAFHPPSTSTSMSASSSAQAQPESIFSAPISQDDKEERTLASTVVTRPAQPGEIQALYAAILGRRKMPVKEQEEQLGHKIAALSTRQHSATGGSGSSLYGSGSEDEQGPEEKSEVMEACDDETTLTAEGLFQKMMVELGPCNPGRKHHCPSIDECDIEDQTENNGEDQQTDSTLSQTDATLLHKCMSFDGMCWSHCQRELLVGVYWFHKGERSLKSVYRRLDKFQVMSNPDGDDDDNNDNNDNMRTALRRMGSRKNISEPASPVLSLDVGDAFSGYLSS
ncbi:hypothetical protein EC991_005098 [Linnemannia zychae]|nr:hypothetical protein EC991_005098 [Linnemannia zychae]